MKAYLMELVSSIRSIYSRIWYGGATRFEWLFGIALILLAIAFIAFPFSTYVYKVFVIVAGIVQIINIWLDR